jgi:hypothetical protein
MLGKEDVSMAEKPANGFTHTVVGEVDYYLKEPKEGDQPDGSFQEGTQVRLIREKGIYRQVESETDIRAWIYAKGTLELIFRLTHEVKDAAEYWIGPEEPDPGRPADETLPAKTKVMLLRSGSRYSYVSPETNPGRKGYIEKHLLKPL